MNRILIIPFSLLFFLQPCFADKQFDDVAKVVTSSANLSVESDAEMQELAKRMPAKISSDYQKGFCAGFNAASITSKVNAANYQKKIGSILTEDKSLAYIRTYIDSIQLVLDGLDNYVVVAPLEEGTTVVIARKSIHCPK